MACHARRHRLADVLRPGVAAVVATLAVGTQAAPAAPVELHVAFEDGARLGGTTSIAVKVAVSPRLPPVTELRLLTPPGIDLTSSGLGVVSCRRPAAEVRAVMSAAGGSSCPANSLLGRGSASAGLLLDPESPIGGEARLTLSAGAPVDDKPGLIVLADVFNPVRMHLTYQGYLYVPPPRFGLGVAILIPQIPKLPFGAPIALTRLRLVVGGSITYTHRVKGHVARYRPKAMSLPAHCRDRALRFGLILRFADGSRRSVEDAVTCPRGR